MGKVEVGKSLDGEIESQVSIQSIELDFWMNLCVCVLYRTSCFSVVFRNRALLDIWVPSSQKLSKQSYLCCGELNKKESWIAWVTLQIIYDKIYTIICGKDRNTTKLSLYINPTSNRPQQLILTYFYIYILQLL